MSSVQKIRRNRTRRSPWFVLKNRTAPHDRNTGHRKDVLKCTYSVFYLVFVPYSPLTCCVAWIRHHVPNKTSWGSRTCLITLSPKFPRRTDGKTRRSELDTAPLPDVSKSRHDTQVVIDEGLTIGPAPHFKLCKNIHKRITSGLNGFG